MGAPPPGDERARIAAPAFCLEERRRNRGEPTLHVDHGAVLVEHADFDVVLDGFKTHGDFLPGPGLVGRILPDRPPSANAAAKALLQRVGAISPIVSPAGLN